MEYKFDVAFWSLLTWFGMSASHLLFIKDKNSLFGACLTNLFCYPRQDKKSCDTAEIIIEVCFPFFSVLWKKVKCVCWVFTNTLLLGNAYDMFPLLPEQMWGKELLTHVVPVLPTEMLFVFVGPPGHLPLAGKVEILRTWSAEVLEMSACQNRAEDDHAGSTFHFAIIREF